MAEIFGIKGKEIRYIRDLNEARCVLHPRWNYDSKEICFDGAEGEYRQVYVLKVDENFSKGCKGVIDICKKKFLSLYLYIMSNLI